MDATGDVARLPVDCAVCLAGEHERLQLVLEGTRLGMWDWNPQTDEVTFDRRWAEMLGHTLAEIPATLESWSSRVHPEDLARCRADIEAHLRGDTAFYENVHRMRHASGRWVYVLDRGKVARRDADGRPIRFTGTHTDITPQKEAEEAANVASREKSLFLARMSHEIRTPLHAILGLLQLFDAETLDTRHQEYLRILRESGEGLLTIVNDLLDMAKVEAGQMRVERLPFEPAVALGSVFDLFRERALSKGLGYDLALSPGLPRWAVADGHRIRQVVGNLLSNAVKFTEAGEVRLTARGEGTCDGGATLVVEVSDTGPGIADLAAIWEPFRQGEAGLSRRFGGTGLGLAISKMVGELLGGSLEARSEPGVGSTFTLRVPVVCTPDDAPEPHSQAALPRVPPWLRVLVADDNPVNRLVVDGMLRRLGLEGVLVENGASAVAACADTRFDVVLMDLHMPVLDGLEATRRIVRAAPPPDGPVVIALSADTMAERRDACRAAGMRELLAKPLRQADLAEVLHRVALGRFAPYHSRP